MSIFDFPRINFSGTIQLNPGTANNDDYDGSAFFPYPEGVTPGKPPLADWGPYGGATLGLIDAANVEARTYGMSDKGFIRWCQKAQPFVDAKGKLLRRKIIPAEWNYYGDMGSKDLDISVCGVQTAWNQVFTAADASVPLSGLIGAKMTFSGSITDINPEGSPPATQFFLNNVKLANDSSTFLNGPASKGTSLWLNFYRNVNAIQDAGSGGYLYHVIPKAKGTTIDLPGFDDPDIVGVVCRYYVSLPEAKYNTNEEIQKLYETGATNPKSLEISGTFSPLYKHETITSAPVGRYMIWNTPNIPAGPPLMNNGPNGKIELAPGVVSIKDNILSADFIGTFPDHLKEDGSNDKYSFGDVELEVMDGSTAIPIGPINYDTAGYGTARGWVFDFDLSNNPNALAALAKQSSFLRLNSPDLNEVVLEETLYYFVTNQQAIYAEQHGPGDEFVSQGSPEKATLEVYHRGERLTRKGCPPVTIWQYRPNPMVSPGDAVAINSNYLPGDPIEIDTSQPGNLFLTFTINDLMHPAPEGYPPQNYKAYLSPAYPDVTNRPSITIRVLPNNEDFSKYYEDPTAAEPIGNASLTFDVVYTKVLRTYYLLYPAMNKIFPMNDCAKVQQFAPAILERTDSAKFWLTSGYMPRTHDMSQSRKTLLQAWCRKVIKTPEKCRK